MSAVRIGQVWLDCDGRPPNRKLMVVSIDETHARCLVAINDGRMSRRHTRIRLDRFKPGSRGYQLIHDVP